MLDQFNIHSVVSKSRVYLVERKKQYDHKLHNYLLGILPCLSRIYKYTPVGVAFQQSQSEKIKEMSMSFSISR